MTTSFIQPFDTSQFRRIGPPGFGTPDTLASIYTFGLGDDAFDDNVFFMPGGNLRFPGSTQWGGARMAAEVAWFQNKAAINLAEAPPYELVSQAWQNNGVGGLGCGTFRVDELNDPNWNGAFSGITGGTIWITDMIAASNDTDQTTAHTNQVFGRVAYDSNGASPKVPGGGGLPPFALDQQLALWNDKFSALTEVAITGGYGNVDRALYGVANGASAQWITHWNNDALVPAAGDGPTWWIDTDGRLSRFNPGAGLQAYQRTNDVTKAWGWRMFAQDSAAALHMVLDVNTDGGTLNGTAITTVDTAMASYVSPLLDMTVAGTGVSFTVPLKRAGFYFAMTGMSIMLIGAFAGPATSNVIVTCGNDAGQTNTVSAGQSTITAANYNTFGPFAPIIAASASGPQGAVQIDAATEITIKWPAVAGLTSGHVRLSVRGNWVPI